MAKQLKNRSPNIVASLAGFNPAIPLRGSLQKDRKRARKAELGAIGAWAGGMAGTAVIPRMLKADKKVVGRFLEKGIKNHIYQFARTPAGSSFTPRYKGITTYPNIGIAAHELGHAKNLRTLKKIFGPRLGRRVQAAAYTGLSNIAPRASWFAGPLSLVPIAPAAIALPLIAGASAIKGKKKGTVRYRAGEWLEEHPGTIVGGAVAPKLLEESTATVRGLKEIARQAPAGKKMTSALRGALSTAPGLATYIGALSLPVIAAWLYGKYRQANKAAT